MNKLLQMALLGSGSDKRKFKIQKRKFAAIGAVILTTGLGGVVAHAQQQAGKVPHIGFLIASSPDAMAPRLNSFRQGLRELGHVDGKNVVIDARYANGKADQLSRLATGLVDLKVDIIVTSGPTATRPAKAATATIPIVMSFDDDPVGSGFVASLARPGGNITGLSTLSPEITGKQLELLKEIIPRLGRVAVIGTSTRKGTAQNVTAMEEVAHVVGVKLQYLDVLDPADIESGFRSAMQGRADAILLLQSPIFNSYRRNIAEQALKARLPVTYYRREFVEEGGLMSYGVNISDLDRRAATYVDKILKGSKPADLPVEQPRSFELVINLKAAKQIGVIIPQSMLYRADLVIK